MRVPFTAAPLRELGRDLPSGVRILALYAYFTARAGLGLPRSRPFRVRLELEDRDIDWWVADLSDFGVLAEVFIHGEYDGPLPQEAELIVDLGSHVGASVMWWRLRYPDAEIVAVEPDPESFDRLRRHVGADPRVRLVQAAIADRSGSTRLVQAGASWSSHLLPDGEEETVDVRGLTFGDLLAEVAPRRTVDLLKVDIEGAEPNVLEASLASISMLAVEVHDADRQPVETVSLEAVALRNGMRQVQGKSNAVTWLVRDPQT